MYPAAFLLCSLIKNICRENLQLNKLLYSFTQKPGCFHVKGRLVNTCSPWILPFIASRSDVITMFDVFPSLNHSFSEIWVNYKTDIIYFVMIGRFNLSLAIFFI